ncbi:hypothetical protein RAS2_26960 [Phycisphaerae bacterium RAS2]|nr:hypothetical protein RAS2_26960 [Phycisphaerae bacterium RAS2]
MSTAYGTRSLREILRILFEHWGKILFIFAVGAGGTWYGCQHWFPLKYRSQVSLVYKRPMNKNPLSLDSPERTLEVFVKAQQQIVMSDLVLARTKVLAENPRLYEQWEVLRREWRQAEKQPNGKVVEALGNAMAFLNGEKVQPKVDKLLHEDQVAFIDFQKAVKLETPGGEQVGMTETFTIKVDYPADREDPDSFQNAYRAASALADMYLVRYQELQQALNEPAERLMTDVVASYDEEYKAREGAYHDFIQENAADVGVLEQLLRSGTEHGVQVLYTKIRESDAGLSVDLARERSLLQVFKEKLPAACFESGGIEKMTDEQIEAAMAAVPASLLFDNVLFVETAKNLTMLMARLAKAEGQFTEDSRDVRYLKYQVSSTKRHALAGIVAYSKGLESSIQAREEQKKLNEGLVKEVAQERAEVQAKLAEYARLKNEFEVAQKHRERLEQERVYAMATRLLSREPVNISILDEASMPDPDKPSSPQTMIYTVVAGIVSLLLGVALAFLADHFDHTVRSTVEAERYLGVPVLGTVKKRGRRLVVPA